MDGNPLVGSRGAQSEGQVTVSVRQTGKSTSLRPKLLGERLLVHCSVFGKKKGAGFPHHPPARPFLFHLPLFLVLFARLTPPAFLSFRWARLP